MNGGISKKSTEPSRFTNWPAYNESLVKRGDVTLWLEGEEKGGAAQKGNNELRPLLFAASPVPNAIGCVPFYFLIK